MRIVLLTPVALLVLLAAIYLLTPMATLEHDVPRHGYVDAHARIAGIGAGDSDVFVHPDLAESFKFGLYLRSFGVTRDELREHGDELIVRRLNRTVAGSRHVRRAVIVAQDGVVRDDALDRAATRVYVPNEYVARMAERYELLEFGASVHPDRSDWRERLVEAKRRGAVLVKWLPAMMNIDPSSRRYTDYYRTLVELDLPLLVHAGREPALEGAGDALGDPRKLGLALREGVTVIAARMGTGGSYEGQSGHERLLSMLQEHPNLYVDISSLTRIDRIGHLVEALQAPDAAERMLYGSDWPLLSVPLVSPFYHWPDIDLSTAKTIQSIDNGLDRDVILKKALGVPPAVFERSGRLLGR